MEKNKYLGKPSEKLSAYIKLVKERTGRTVLIRPYDDDVPPLFVPLSMLVQPAEIG